MFRRMRLLLFLGISTLCKISLLFPGVAVALSLSSSSSPSSISSSTNSRPSKKKKLSLGQAIQSVSNVEQGLELASQFWLPTDENLPVHYQQQLVHHETRQRWASQLIEKMTASQSMDTHDHPHHHHNHLQDARLSRLILAAALPFENSEDRIQKEGQWMLNSLQGLHAILGRMASSESSVRNDHGDADADAEDDAALAGIQQLIARACALGESYSLDQACQLQWAIQGIKSKLNHPLLPQFQPKPIATADNDDDDHDNDDNDNDDIICHESLLRERVAQLPFAIVPRGIDWSDIGMLENNSNNNNNNNNNDSSCCQQLIQAIPFSKDTITTRQGTSVRERRGTAWIAKEGVGALAYSGKLMTPQPIPELVSQVLRRVEDSLDLNSNTNTNSNSNSNHDLDKDEFFDCVLCNHYADATAACKFHTDPEHGSHWDRTTVVVAAGSDRKFAFKPIDTTWQEHDSLPTMTTTTTTTAATSNLNENNNNNNNNDNNKAAWTHLFAGDLVVMRDNCNDDFYHAVHAGETDEPRISLVLKRAIDRGNGQKGHGLQGQGRRSRRRPKNNPTTKRRR